jgi:hypothetical protein
MVAELDDLQARKLNEVASEYRRKGYSVLVKARGKKLPRFLSDLEIDLLAESDAEQVVIEVKTSKNLQGSPEMARIAERIEGKPGWRFELVVTNPRGEINGNGQPSLSQPEIDTRLNQAMELAQMGFSNAGYILASATAEAALRLILQRQGIRAGTRSPVGLIKSMLSYGIVGAEEYEGLSDAMARWGSLVHGFRTTTTTPADVMGLVAFVEKLLHGR